MIEDGFRSQYLRRHLEAVKSAMEAGSRIGGYFTWTLIDNWEWDIGYTSKFGLVAMDRDDRRAHAQGVVRGGSNRWRRPGCCRQA